MNQLSCDIDMDINSFAAVLCMLHDMILPCLLSVPKKKRFSLFFIIVLLEQDKGSDRSINY